MKPNKPDKPAKPVRPKFMPGDVVTFPFGTGEGESTVFATVEFSILYKNKPTEYNLAGWHGKFEESRLTKYVPEKC